MYFIEKVTYRYLFAYEVAPNLTSEFQNLVFIFILLENQQELNLVMNK